MRRDAIADSLRSGKGVKIGHFNVIDDDVVLGAGVIVDDFCKIHAGVVVGDGTRIRSYVELRPGTRIGKDCYIDSYVVSSGENVIGDRVTLRYRSIIARGCAIGDDAYVAPQTMFENLNAAREAIGGAKIGARCFIGTNAVLKAGIVIAADTIIGSKALVTKSVETPGVYVGVPARKVG